jgi:hypothetical protein
MACSVNFSAMTLTQPKPQPSSSSSSSSYGSNYSKSLISQFSFLPNNSNSTLSLRYDTTLTLTRSRLTKTPSPNASHFTVRPFNSVCLFGAYDFVFNSSLQDLIITALKCKTNSFTDILILNDYEQVMASAKKPEPLKIMISGAPASGKGTQCELITQKVRSFLMPLISLSFRKLKVSCKR